MSFRKIFFAMMSLALSLMATAAFAAEGASAGTTDHGLLGAALAVGIAAFGGALGQGRIAGSALDGIARNPGASGKMFVPFILGLVLIESLVIYAFVIALMKT